MTDAQKRTARALQRLVEDEIGERPMLTDCQRFVVERSTISPGGRREEVAARIWEDKREELTASARRRSERRDR